MRHKTIGKLIFIIVWFLVPIFFMLYLYPLEKRIIFNGKKYQQTEFVIENLFQKEPISKNLVAKIFSTVNFLEWYEVYIKNNYTPKTTDCFRPEFSMTFLEFTQGDPRTYYSTLQETTEDSGGYAGPTPGHPSYYIKSGEEAVFIAPAWQTYSINGGFGTGLNSSYRSVAPCGEFTSKISEIMRSPISEGRFDFDISIKPLRAAWIARLFIISMFWLFIVSSFLTIWNWVMVKTPQRSTPTDSPLS